MTTAKISIDQTIAKPAIQKRAPIPKAKARARAKKISSRYAKSLVDAQYEAILVRLGLDKFLHARTPHELPQGPHRQSQRNMQSKQGLAQSQIVIYSGEQEVEGRLAEAAPPKEKTTEESKAKTGSRILKPRAGAGDSRRGDRSGRYGNGGSGHVCPCNNYVPYFGVFILN